MEMRELIQDNRTMHGGIHFPLCIKFKGICRRSEDGQARRTRGTPQYEEKMQRRLPDTAQAEQRSNYRQYVREGGHSTNQGLEQHIAYIPVEDAWGNYNPAAMRSPETNAAPVRADFGRAGTIRADPAPANTIYIDLPDTSAHTWPGDTRMKALEDAPAEGSRGGTTHLPLEDAPIERIPWRPGYVSQAYFWSPDSESYEAAQAENARTLLKALTN